MSSSNNPFYGNVDPYASFVNNSTTLSDSMLEAFDEIHRINKEQRKVQNAIERSLMSMRCDVCDIEPYLYGNELHMCGHVIDRIKGVVPVGMQRASGLGAPFANTHIQGPLYGYRLVLKIDETERCKMFQRLWKSTSEAVIAGRFEYPECKAIAADWLRDHGEEDVVKALLVDRGRVDTDFSVAFNMLRSKESERVAERCCSDDGSTLRRL